MNHFRHPHYIRPPMPMEHPFCPPEPCHHHPHPMPCVPPPPPPHFGRPPHHHHHHNKLGIDEEKLLKLLISKTAKGSLDWHRKMETNSWETEAEDYLYFRLRSHMIYIINQIRGTETAITFSHSNADLVRILEHLIRDGVEEVYHRHHLDAIQIIEESDEEDIDYTFADFFGDLHSDWKDAKVKLNLADVDSIEDYEDNYAPKEELIKWKPKHHHNYNHHDVDDHHFHRPVLIDPEDEKPLPPLKPHNPCHSPVPPYKPPKVDNREYLDYKDNDKYPVFDNVSGTGYNKPSVKPDSAEEPHPQHKHHKLHLPDLDI